MQQALRALTGRHPGRGFRKLHHRLRKNGLIINYKRTLHMCRALALNLLRRLKKRVPARVKQPLVVLVAANVCWSLDFTSDVLTDGRRVRTLNVLDAYNRQLLGVESDFANQQWQLQSLTIKAPHVSDDPNWGAVFEPRKPLPRLVRLRELRQAFGRETMVLPAALGQCACSYRPVAAEPALLLLAFLPTEAPTDTTIVQELTISLAPAH